MTTRVSLFVLLATMLSGTALADEVDEILQGADAALLLVEDQTYDGEVQVIRDGVVTKTLRFVVKLKGLKRKLVKFTFPGDVRGMAVLTTADDLMYVYMPAYKRVRRVAAHVRNQGFMGTDFSPDEMSNAALSTGWDARIAGEDDQQWLLEMTPRPETETAYAKMVVTVDKSNGAAWKLECYDAEGKLVRTQVRSEWVDFGPISLPTVYTITDHRTGSKSVLRLSNCKVNQGIPDSEFTKRALIRGD